MTRVTAQLVADVEARLSPRDRGVIEAVGLLGLVTARQLERLFWIGGDPASRARLRRHGLARLVDLGILTTLERRVGGIRSGSAGYIYGLDRLGQRLHQPQRTGRLRSPEEPGLLFVRHRLGVSELYVLSRETARAGRLELLAWQSEPDCHRGFVGPGAARLTLKPDAYLRVGIGAYEDSYFLELETGSHGRAAVGRKLDTYTAYYKSGREQSAHSVFPKVLLVATTRQHAGRLGGWIAELPEAHQRLFAVTSMEEFPDFLTQEASS